MSLPREGDFVLTPHAADIGVRAEADSWAGLLKVAAQGLLAAGGIGTASEEPSRGAAVGLEGASREELLVDWLNEWIYRIWCEGWVPYDVRLVEAGERRVRAVLKGNGLRDGEPAREIKAASYHGLSVEFLGGRWTATVILDV